jgi:hypothetical protein
MTTIDEIMSDVQSFASSWALVGSRFDDGSMHNMAEAQSAALRDMIAAAIADARREGAEQMREACAKASEETYTLAVAHGDTNVEIEPLRYPTGMKAGDIRALPLPTGSQS